MRAAVAGHDDVRIFKKVDGVWRAQDGQPVQLIYAWQNGNAAIPAQESHFICSKELGRQLISRLMNGRNPARASPPPSSFSPKRRAGYASPSSTDSNASPADEDYSTVPFFHVPPSWWLQPSSAFDVRPTLAYQAPNGGCSSLP